jgi:hypothetical protein
MDAMSEQMWSILNPALPTGGCCFLNKPYCILAAANMTPERVKIVYHHQPPDKQTSHNNVLGHEKLRAHEQHEGRNTLYKRNVQTSLHEKSSTAARVGATTHPHC